MPLEDVCVHLGKPLKTGEGGTWIEGEFVPNAEAEGAPFPCVLFLPQSTTEETVTVPIGRRITEPTLLYLPEDDDGNPVALNAEDSVLINAPELWEAEGKLPDFWERYQVVGRPQPFGKPGEPVIGFQATLRLVSD